MGELVDRDQEHLRLLMWAYYLLAGTTGFAIVISIPVIMLGGMLTSIGMPRRGDPLVGPILFGIGLAILVLGGTATLLTYLAGRYIRDRRNRTFCLVLASLWCLQIPWGTAIGISTISVLNRAGVKSLFEHAQLPPNFSPPAGI
jgi:formate/nitrite transporter FocA (FNT family)